MCLRAQITPSWMVSCPFGPTRVTPGEPRTSPESRTGASIPRKNSSVRETSTWSAGGWTEHAHALQGALGADDVQRLFAGELPRLRERAAYGQLMAGPEQRLDAGLSEVDVACGDGDGDHLLGSDAVLSGSDTGGVPRDGVLFIRDTARVLRLRSDEKAATGLAARAPRAVSPRRCRRPELRLRVGGGGDALFCPMPR